MEHEVLFSSLSERERESKITKLFRGSAGIKLSRVARTCGSRTVAWHEWSEDVCTRRITWRDSIPERCRINRVAGGV